MIRYFFRRILPFVSIYLAIQCAVRLALVVREWSNLDVSLAQGAMALLVGVVFDLAVAGFMLIPLVLYLLFLPQKRHMQAGDRRAIAILYGVFIFLMLFNVAAEWAFWDEFSTRFNFIAVDYLIYTQEVLANIWQSYPVPLLLGLLALVASAIYYSTRHHLIPRQHSAPHFWHRLQAVAIWGVLTVGLFFSTSLELMTISRNQYLNEIAGDGLYGLFSAFFNNELDYNRFYDVETAKLLNENIRTLLTEQEMPFVNNEPGDITRVVRRDGPEKHLNVVLVAMESMSAEYMASFGGTRNLTPNLDALAKESLFFTNLYATGTRTVRGLEALTLSIPPTPGNSILRRPDNAGLFSLGYVFQDRGYDTRFIYGGHGYFDNMNNFFAGNGFSIIDQPVFRDDEIEFSNAWGVCDEDLFKKVISEGNASYAAGKPFMSMVMTTSNHRPYTFPEGRIDMPSEGGGREAGVKYADYAVGQLIAQARTKPWFKDTVFVFVADHTAGSAGKLTLTPEKYHIPMMIYSPAHITPQVRSAITSQIDVAPTLLGQLNFSYFTKFYGEDVMNDPDEAVPHAFISTYQMLGLVREGHVLVLEPNRKSESYDMISGAAQANDPQMLHDAITYYQHASGWKERMRRIPTILPENTAISK
ncbi:MAG: sulfatase-like hydrolase/transferase [Rickettsiales bacterium]|nr:sulfatase-like hydrolase/transferase [Rickettsiales bacterium]